MKKHSCQDIPYPIGIYEYKEMTGDVFDINLINEVYRYIFKGSEDEGGWQNCEEDGKTTRYTGKEYYEQFEMPQIAENSRQRNTLIDAHGDLTDMEQKEILYKAYDGKTLLDKFLAIKSIFKDLKLDKSEFVVYEGLGHEITDKIQQDELEFFNKVLKNE